MVRRRAVGATIASVLLFGSLIVSNFALVAAQEQRQQLSSVAYEENLLTDQASIAGSESLFLLLGSVQRSFSSGTLPCASFGTSASGLISTLRANVTIGRLVADSGATLAADVNAQDNLTFLHPFTGSVPGYLNILASVGVSGADLGGLVTMRKTEVHLLHLPMSVAAGVSYCLRSVETIKSNIEALGSSMCNGTTVMGRMAALDEELSRTSVRLGFSFLLRYSLADLPQCRLNFTVGLSQPDVPGPLGLFSWTLEQQGSASQ